VNVCEGIGVWVTVGVSGGVREPNMPEPNIAVSVWLGAGKGVSEPNIPEPNKAVMVKLGVGGSDLEGRLKNGRLQASIVKTKTNIKTKIPSFLFIKAHYSFSSGNSFINNYIAFVNRFIPMKSPPFQYRNAFYMIRLGK
jgi:hypothetical protein